MPVEVQGCSYTSELVLPTPSSLFRQTQVDAGRLRPGIHGILCLALSELGGNDMPDECWISAKQWISGVL